VSAVSGGTVVVKVGGGLLAIPGALERVAGALAAAAAQRRLVIVPGGGPFADAVRRFDATHGLSPGAAHWMAILAQDQYAHALAERVPGGLLASDPETISAAHAAGRVPVLAPARWMLTADVLPHSWDATSDSVAAFVAGALDAEVLVLVKPVGGSAGELADAGFDAALPAGLPVFVLGVEEMDRLGELLKPRRG
jgi:aspartokinase-like uncharacterized kinase